MTAEQIAEVRRRLNKMPREQIAEEVGVSVSNLKRWARDSGIRFTFSNKHRANPKRTTEVCRFYEKHGMIETRKRYPDLCIRSIVECYKIFKPRRIRWTDAELVDAARMAGFVSKTRMAKHFGRPGAHEGSIVSLFQKRRLSFAPHSIHGMPHNHAKHLITPSCPFLKLRYRRTYLWTDMAKHLRPGMPAFIRDAVKTMARFQCWLYDTKNPRAAMLRMMKEHK